jgi:hypothetical protein
MKKWMTMVIAVSMLMTVPLALAGEKVEKSEKKGVNATLVELEKQLWRAWGTHDPDAADKLMREDAKLVGPWGTWDKDSFIAQIREKNCEVRGWNLSEIEVTKLSRSAMLLSYTAEQDATCGGDDVMSPIVVSSVWARRGAIWQHVLYDESPLETE